MEIVLTACIVSRAIQFLCLLIITFLYLVGYPFTGAAAFFDVQAIFDFTYLGIPRVLDITNKLINGTIDFRADSHFPLGLKFTGEPVNIVHDYNYSDWTYDFLDHPRPDHKSLFGPLLASYLTIPWSLNQKQNDKLFVQSMARLSVAFLVLFAFFTYCSAVTRKFGHYTTSTLTFLTMSQFYFLFNFAQFVPNCLSLFMALITSAAWLSRHNTLFVVFGSITIGAFHSVTIFLFLPMAIQSINKDRNFSVMKLLFWGVSCGYLSFFVSGYLDSFMWGNYVWPQSKLFRDLVNKSTHDLGFSTLVWYTFVALPQYLFSSVIFIPFASRRCMKSCFTVSYIYLVLCSLFGYKDLNLLLYVVPLLNTCAANTIAISFYRFFTLRPHSESWLVYLIRRKLGHQVTPSDEFEAQEELMDERERRPSAAELERIRRHNTLPYEYIPVAPTDWQIATAPPPYTPTPVPEQIPLTAISLQHTSPRGRRQLPQSSPSNFLRRRGGLRKPGRKVPTNSNDRETTTSEDNNSSSNRPRQIPVAADSMIHRRASHYGSIFAVIVTFHFCVNIIFLIYYNSTIHHRYPGGNAVAWLNQHIKQTDLTIVEPKDVGVYVGKLAIETGFTRFLQMHGITYDTSSDIYTMATRSQRMNKYRNIHKPQQLVHHQPGLYPFDFDFKVIYFILDHVGHAFTGYQCLKTPKRPIVEGTTAPLPPIATIGITDEKASYCILSRELDNCRPVQTITSYGGLELSHATKSIAIVHVPSIWIYRCVVSD